MIDYFFYVNFLWVGLDFYNLVVYNSCVEYFFWINFNEFVIVGNGFDFFWNGFIKFFWLFIFEFFYWFFVNC